jgi:hypothetical protein
MTTFIDNIIKSIIKDNDIYDIILSIFLGILSVILINYLYGYPRVIHTYKNKEL